MMRERKLLHKAAETLALSLNAAMLIQLTCQYKDTGNHADVLKGFVQFLHLSRSFRIIIHVTSTILMFVTLTFLSSRNICVNFLKSSSLLLWFIQSYFMFFSKRMARSLLVDICHRFASRASLSASSSALC